MFERVSAVLEQAIGELEIPVDAAALTRCVVLLDRFTAKVTAAVATFEESEAWRDVGATSMAAWLRRHTGRSHRDAARLTRTGKRLADLPVTAGAFQDGVLSSGQVQAIVANLNDHTAPLFGEAEHELVPKLARLDVKQVSDVMQAWAAAAKDHLQPDPADDQAEQPAGPERSLHLSETMDGRGELSGSFDAEARAITETALRLADSPDTDAEPARSPARRRADALIDILRFFLDHQTTQTGGRHRPHLNVIVNYEDLTGHRPSPSSCAATTTGAGDHDASPTSRGTAGHDADAAHEHIRTPDRTADRHRRSQGGSQGDGNENGEAGRGSSTPQAVMDSRQRIDDDGHERPNKDSETGSRAAGGQRRGRGDGSRDADRYSGRPGAVVDGPLRPAGTGRLLDGTVLDAATLHRLACDAGIHRVIMAGRSSILDYGWTTRTIPANLWAAVVTRDEHCRFPGCDRPPQWCEAHHIIWWEHGGPTSIVNLALYCTRHHHVLHTPGWSAEMLPDGTIHITDPKGQVHTTSPPGKLTHLFTEMTERPSPATHRPAA